MQHVTIKDLARSLNLSVATISRAFNDKYDIRKETRELIIRKAKEMGYKPNPIARKLLQKHSYNVGVIVPEFINAYFPEVIIGIQHFFCEKGYQVIIMQSNECAETETKNLAFMENNMVDGLLISLSKETQNLAYLERLAQDRFPVVLFNRVNDQLQVPRVEFNDYKWALFATEHLIEQGYRNLCVLSGPRHLTLMKNRVRGFLRALEKHGLPVHEGWVMEAGLFIEDGERALDTLIREGRLPEAIFATNDPLAIGAMKRLKQAGYRIPEDVGVAGFSNSIMAELVDPPLTSVVQPTHEIGQTAAQLLLEQMTAVEPLPPRTIVMEGRLIVRQSSSRSAG